MGAIARGLAATLALCCCPAPSLNSTSQPALPLICAAGPNRKEPVRHLPAAQPAAHPAGLAARRHSCHLGGDGAAAGGQWRVLWSGGVLSPDAARHCLKGPGGPSSRRRRTPLTRFPAPRRLCLTSCETTACLPPVADAFSAVPLKNSRQPIAAVHRAASAPASERPALGASGFCVVHRVRIVCDWGSNGGSTPTPTPFPRIVGPIPPTVHITPRPSPQGRCCPTPWAVQCLLALQTTTLPVPPNSHQIIH